MQTVIHILRATANIAVGPLRLQVLFDVHIECFHVMSQSCETIQAAIWCTVEWRLSMLHDAHAKCSLNLTADGLTSQVCLISLYTRYML